MPKVKLSEYSQTAANNTDINSINLAEGMLPSDVNNAIRELMKQLKDFQVGAQGDGATFSSLNLTTTPLAVASGGTGATSFSSGALLKGSGTSAVAVATAGTDYPGLASAQTFTAPQRGTVTTDNDGSFDLSVTNNFQCTPTATFALTFTNRTAGQSGFILLINTGGYAVTAHADTLVQTGALTAISAAGTYLLSYFATSSKVYVTHSGAMA